MKCLRVLVYVSLLVGLQMQSVLCNGHIGLPHRNGVLPARGKSHNRNINSIEPGRNDFSFSCAVIWIYMNEYLSMSGEVVSSKTKNYCTGNIVSPSWVLTAAQCFQPLVADQTSLGKQMEEAIVPYGGTVHIGEEWIIINKINVHPKYNKASPTNSMDLALLKLAQDFQIPHPGHKSSVAVFADHFPADSDLKEPASLKRCWVIGFGKYNRAAKNNFVKKLRGYPATAGGNSYCTHLRETLDKSKTSYAPFYSCALGEVNKEFKKVTRGTTCLGDVGGALVCGGRLTGITSQRWESELCGGDNAFTAFISVGHPDALEWIKKLVEPAPVVKANDAADAEEGRAENRDGGSAADSTSSHRPYIAVVVALGVVALTHVQ